MLKFQENAMLSPNAKKCSEEGRTCLQVGTLPLALHAALRRNLDWKQKKTKICALSLHLYSVPVIHSHQDCVQVIFRPHQSPQKARTSLSYVSMWICGPSFHYLPYILNPYIPDNPNISLQPSLLYSKLWSRWQPLLSNLTLWAPLHPHSYYISM